MPSPYYSEEGPLKLRKLLASSKVHDIGTGFQSLGADVEKYLLSLSGHSTNWTAKAGELGQTTGSGTITATLPAATTLSQIIGFFAGGVTTLNVTTSGGAHIYGDAINGTTTITLLTNQHVLLMSDGANWTIVGGTPSGAISTAELAEGAVTEDQIAPEAVTTAKLASSVQAELKDSLGSQGIGSPGARTSASFATSYEPSLSRPTEVMLDIGFGGATGEHGVAQVYLDGILRSEPLLPSLTGWTTIAPVSFICPAGQKWSVINVTNGVGLHFSYLGL